MSQLIGSSRIDVPGNRGNAGVFVHKIDQASGEPILLVEKRSTSAREKLFYCKYYALSRNFNIPISPRVHAIDASKHDGWEVTIFMNYCQPITTKELETHFLNEAIELIRNTYNLPTKWLGKYDTKVFGFSSIKMIKFMHLCNEIYPSLPISKTLQNSIQSFQSKVQGEINSLPYVAQHSDVKPGNMGISLCGSSNHLCLLDWGCFAARRLGYDFKNLLSYSPNKQSCNIDLLAEMCRQYVSSTDYKHQLKAIMLCALVAGANSRVTRFLRTKNKSLALQYFASMEAALRLV